MVTASHNPKADNGYKVYWSNGCQIVPPIDEDIANSITEECNLIPWIDYGAKLQQLKSDASSSCFGLSDTLITKQMEDEYFAIIESSGLISKDVLSSNNSSPPKFVYTSMHGVGHPYVKRAFETFNLPPFHAVPSQCTPDPEFPTVSFPNPEEKGALNEAMDFALKMGCQIVLANDPDADRLGVAEYSNSKWTVFTGDQIGILLGVWLWEIVGKTSDKVSHLIFESVDSPHHTLLMFDDHPSLSQCALPL
jgi:phosphoglucomutase/phosphoglucomutase/phosphopentomutase